MTTKSILLDVDEVLLQYDNAFLGYHDIQLMEGHGYWSYESIHDLQDHNIQELIENFNVSPYFANIEPLDGAVEAVNKLKELGYSINLLSACGTSTETRFYRRCNLLDVFGDVFDNIELINLRESKLSYLQKYKSTHLWVDDSISHYNSGIACGIPSVLMRSQFNCNQDLTDERIAYSWEDVLQLVEQNS